MFVDVPQTWPLLALVLSSESKLSGFPGFWVPQRSRSSLDRFFLVEEGTLSCRLKLNTALHTLLGKNRSKWTSSSSKSLSWQTKSLPASGARACAKLEHVKTTDKNWAGDNNHWKIMQNSGDRGGPMHFSRGDSRLWWFSCSIKPFGVWPAVPGAIFCEKDNPNTRLSKNRRNWLSKIDLLQIARQSLFRGSQNQKLTYLGEGPTHSCTGNAIFRCFVFKHNTALTFPC